MFDIPVKNSRFQKIREKLKQYSVDHNVEINIIKEYQLEGQNISVLAKKYDEPYSNFRRFLWEEIKAHGNEADFQVDYLNVVDFKFLEIGDTFQFADWLTTWQVIKIMDKESEKVFLTIPTKKRNPERHWICDELVKTNA